jgi:hypothetical protein
LHTLILILPFELYEFTGNDTVQGCYRVFEFRGFKEMNCYVGDIYTARNVSLFAFIVSSGRLIGHCAPMEPIAAELLFLCLLATFEYQLMVEEDL